MFTKTADINQVGSLRFYTEDLKLIPSVQLPFNLGYGVAEIIILGFGIQNTKSRLILELLYLLYTHKITLDEFADYFTHHLDMMIEDKEKFELELTYLRKIKDTSENQYPPILMSKEDLTKVLEVLTQEGNLCVTMHKKIRGFRMVTCHEDINEEFLEEVYGDSYYEILAKVAPKDGWLAFGDGKVFYPEDVFVNSQYMDLEFYNRSTGDAYRSYETLAHAYATESHFRDNPDFFNKTTCSCGSGLVIRKNNNDEYTLMSCINPFCFEKIGISISDFFTALGLKGLGNKTAIEIAYNIAKEKLIRTGDFSVGYSDIFKTKNPTASSFSIHAIWGEFYEKIESYQGTLADFIVAMNLPYISSDAAKVLSPDIFSNKELNPKTLMNYARSQGHYDLKFVFMMWTYLPDIRYLIDNVATKVNLGQVHNYTIYITKGVLLEQDDGSRAKLTKGQFVELLNETFRKHGISNFQIKLNGSLTRECNILIADQERDTSSCQRAENWGIPILTSRQFLSYLGGANNEQGAEQQ